MATRRISRPARATRWCFTLNNPTPEEIKELEDFVTIENVAYGIIGREVGEKGTPHLQGFVRLQKKLALVTLKKKIANRAHFENAKGSDIENKDYCSKDGDVMLEVGLASQGDEKGGKCMAERISEAISNEIKTGQDVTDVWENVEKFKAYVHAPKVIKDVVDRVKRRRLMAKSKLGFEGVVWKPWQQKIIDIVAGEVDVRKVYWIYDPIGNSGKTFLTKYLLCGGDCVRFENGKSADLKYTYNGERVALWDNSRGQEQVFNYAVLESIKNGVMYSPKYQSECKFFDPPHVIVFSNWLPDETQLSADRWEIVRISESECVSFAPCGALPSASAGLTALD